MAYKLWKIKFLASLWALQKKHPSALVEYERRKNKRKTTDLSDAPISKQLRISDCVALPRSSVSQQQIDTLITNFVTGTFQCFSIVEHEDFICLLKAFDPSTRIMTRKTLVARIDEACLRMKDTLRECLLKVPVVCCTADCWTSFHR